VSILLFSPIENDIAKAADKIEQVKIAFRDAHDKLSQCTVTTADTNMLGSTNTVRLTQEMIDNRVQIANLVDSGKLLSPTMVPRVEDYRQSRSHHNKGYSQRSQQHQPRQHNAYYTGDGSSYYDPSGSGYGYSSNKRRRY